MDNAHVLSADIRTAERNIKADMFRATRLISDEIGALNKSADAAIRALSAAASSQTLQEGWLVDYRERALYLERMLREIDNPVAAEAIRILELHQAHADDQEAPVVCSAGCEDFAECAICETRCCVVCGAIERPYDCL